MEALQNISHSTSAFTVSATPERRSLISITTDCFITCAHLIHNGTPHFTTLEDQPLPDNAPMSLNVPVPKLTSHGSTSSLKRSNIQHEDDLAPVPRQKRGNSESSGIGQVRVTAHPSH